MQQFPESAFKPELSSIPGINQPPGFIIKSELPTTTGTVPWVPADPKMAELPMNQNNSPTRVRTETNTASQFAVEIGAEESGNQRPELDSTGLPEKTPAALRTPVIVAPVLPSGKETTNAELSSDTASPPAGIDTGSDMTNMSERAMEMESRGEYGTAEKIYQQVVEWRRNMEGPGHADTLSTMYRLVLVYDMQHKYREADELYQQILALRESALGPNASPPSLGEALMLQHKYEAAEQMDRQEIVLNRRVLGPEHRYTLLTMGNLANVLRIQGKFEEAEGSYRQTLELSDRVLGPEHPYTLQILNNLGVTLEMQRKRGEAREIYRDTLERNVRKRGYDHPDTYPSLHNLKTVLEENEEIRIQGPRAGMVPPSGGVLAGRTSSRVSVTIIRKS